MQNKANFQKVKFDVTNVLTRDYGQLDTWSIRKTKPIQSQSKPIQSQFKANQSQSKPIQSQFKANKMPKQTQLVLRSLRRSRIKPNSCPPSVWRIKGKIMDKMPNKRNKLSLLRLRFILSNTMFARILSFYTKYFAAWVILFGVVAYFLPAPFVALKPYNEWFFALTMFGIGAVLQIDDFKRVAARPTIVLIGCCAQFSIMPLGAFLLSKLFAFPPELAVGLILTGSAPGAMASNVMSYIAKADTAYSVSLTTISTLLCPLLTPGLTFFLAGSELTVDFWSMVLSVLKMVIVPLLVGFGVRHFLKEKIKKVLPVFPAISVTFIIFICSLVIALNKGRLMMVTGPILAAGIILNIYGISAGYGIGSLFRMANKRRRTLAIEIGMQNAGLGTVLALKHFNEKTAIPAAIFVFICIITASIMAEVWQKRKAKE
jgi:BASS family bile acid:Na+ symporter